MEVVVGRFGADKFYIITSIQIQIDALKNYKRWNIQEDPTRVGREGGSEYGMSFGQMKVLLQK